jgi:hypothetical protein
MNLNRGVKTVALLSLAATLTSASAIEGVFQTKPDAAFQKIAEGKKDPKEKQQFLDMASAMSEVLTISSDKLIWKMGLGTLTWDLKQKGEFMLATHDFPDGSRGYAAMYIKDNDTVYVGEKAFYRDKTAKEK